MKKKQACILLLLLTLCMIIINVHSQTIDLSKASLLVSPAIKSPVRETMIRTFQEEVKQRTAIPIPVTETWNIKNPVIVLVQASQTELLGKKVPCRDGLDFPEQNAEGFRITLEQKAGTETIWLIGHDERGIFYAIGRFLRETEFSPKKIQFDKKNAIAGSPAYPVRGHQLGYRGGNNTWDFWTVKQYEKYIRELVLFGCNSIENTPFQGKFPGRNMKLTPGEMNVEISKLCHCYDIDYWVWTPATVDLSDETIFREQVRKHSEYYRNTPYLDDVFVPGGDPGDNHPRYVLPFLKAIAAELKKYHPEAGVWGSLQGFNDEETDYFFDYIDRNKPDWLKGVVSGPGSPDMAATRFRLPGKYMHRHYPDITHTVRCQYPAPDFDQALALTLGREACNPQPFFYAGIQRKFEPFTDGSVTYSDGVHDDVNKFVWACLDWNPDENVRQILVKYARFFFGTVDAGAVADGILALEQNWLGPLEQNGAVETTLAFWQQLETKHPELDGNWRWVQLVMRAYYDAYTRRRKQNEQELEKEANLILAKAAAIGADCAMDQALPVVFKVEKEPVAQDLRNKIEELCERLFRLVGMQTSVEKYHASGPERGCILDFVDYPLNNRWWLEDEFRKIRAMSSEQEKLARLEVIRTWSNPGTGSYYDNISDISQSPHVNTQMRKSYGYAWWNQGMSRKRLSTQLYQHLPVLVYEGLDPNGSYTVWIAGEGEALLRVDGERIAPSAYPKKFETFKEFHMAKKYVADGKITLTFDEAEELNLNWRQQSKICDVWLIKK